MATYDESVTDGLALTGARALEWIPSPILTEALAFTDAFSGNQAFTHALTDAVACTDTTTNTAAFIRALTDAIAYTDTTASFRTAVETLAERLEFSDVLADNAVLAVAITDGINVGLLLTTPDGVDVWVVNSAGASSRYDGFVYNSMAMIRGKPYGAATGGIYRLDADAEIDGSVQLGKRRWGSSHRKNVPEVWLGVKSSKPMAIRVVGEDGKTYTYKARQAPEDVATARVTIGKGLRMVYWELEIVNTEGADFELDAVEFNPAIFQRRS
jgi:hypothetical protein